MNTKKKQKVKFAKSFKTFLGINKLYRRDKEKTQNLSRALNKFYTLSRKYFY